MAEDLFLTSLQRITAGELGLGEVINAADGPGIRDHMAVTGVRARSWAKEHVDLGRAGVANARRLAMPSR